MPSGIQIRLTRNGPRELRAESGVQADLLRRAHAVASAAGPGHTVNSGVTGGAGRFRAEVTNAGDIDAILEEARNQTLTRAFDAARG